MPKVMLVIGEVSSTQIAAFKTAIRATEDAEPFIGFVPGEFSNIEDVAMKGLFPEEHEEALGDEQVRSDHVSALKADVLQRALPMGTTLDDIFHVLWSEAAGQDDTSFDWLELDDSHIVHCVIRRGQDGKIWFDCPLYGVVDATSALYSVS